MGVVWMGQVVRSWLRRDWAQERAVDVRVAFRVEGLVVLVVVADDGGNGFVSRRRRLPRS